MTADNPFPEMLRSLLRESGIDRIYPCIADLVRNGLVLGRFQSGERTPERQDITQYLAAWSRHAGLSEEQSRDWLIEYCASVLAPLSKRTPAAIRHSTKSNLRYIYKSEVPFLCECAENRFRAECRNDCPVYAEMQASLASRKEAAANPLPRQPPPAPIISIVLPVKAANREQFETALGLIRAEAGKGTKPKRILEMLHGAGLKTRTGREWSYTILKSELAKLSDQGARPGSNASAQDAVGSNKVSIQPAGE